MATPIKRSPRTSTAALGLAVAAVIVGGLFAAVSIHWGLGGTWLLDTVGGSLEAQGRAGSTALIALVWLSVLLKIIAALLPLTVIRQWGPAKFRRLIVVLAWLAGIILTAYGLLLTAVGVLIQLGLIPTDPTANHRALAWHAFLWDPWFLIWGALTLTSLAAWRLSVSRRA